MIHIKGGYSMDTTVKFIWGVKSKEDSSSEKAGIATINDIDICFDEGINKYLLTIKTDYKFSNNKEERIYINSLFENLTKWMKYNKYGTSKQLPMDTVFNKGFLLTDEFASVEDLYAAFKCLVNGFCN
jgi:hypothetical protein